MAPERPSVFDDQMMKNEATDNKELALASALGIGLDLV
jgi:hypothetical protein